MSLDHQDAEDRELLTDIHDPSETERVNDAAIVEALNPQGKSEASPRANEILGSLPEENGDSSARYAGDDRGEHEEATQRRVRGIHRLKDSKTEDEDEACEGECVEADEEEG